MNDRTDGEDEAKPSPAPMSVERALELAERVMAAEAAGSAIETILTEGESPASTAESESPPASESESPPASESRPASESPPASESEDERPGPRFEAGAPGVATGERTSESSRSRPRTEPTAPLGVVGPPSAAPNAPPRDRAARERGGRPGRHHGPPPPTGPELTNVKKVRSPFGTRVARKITCGVCGAEDTIHFAPRKGQAPMCRRCAAERLGVIDRDANIGPEQREKCDRCGLFVKTACTYEDPLDCPEHARALAFRQQDRARTGTRSKKNVIRVRRADIEDG